MKTQTKCKAATTQCKSTDYQTADKVNTPEQKKIWSTPKSTAKDFQAVLDGKDIPEERWFAVQRDIALGNDPRFTLIAHTKDGKPVYWGKKEADEPTSRDLTLWVTYGIPRTDGKNYRRVPTNDEIMLMHTFNYNMKAWDKHIAERIAATTEHTIRTAWSHS